MLPESQGQADNCVYRPEIPDDDDDEDYLSEDDTGSVEDLVVREKEEWSRKYPTTTTLSQAAPSPRRPAQHLSNPPPATAPEGHLLRMPIRAESVHSNEDDEIALGKEEKKNKLDSIIARREEKKNNLDSIIARREQKEIRIAMEESRKSYEKEQEVRQAGEKRTAGAKGESKKSHDEDEEKKNTSLALRDFRVTKASSDKLDFIVWLAQALVVDFIMARREQEEIRIAIAERRKSHERSKKQDNQRERGQLEPRKRARNRTMKTRESRQKMHARKWSDMRG